MPQAIPVSLLQLALFVLIAFGFPLVVLATRLRAAKDDSKTRRDRRSLIGIIVQGLAMGLTAAGPIRAELPVGDPRALAGSALALLFGGGAIWLFAASVRTLGTNWSFVARTRGDHQLVTSGPYARVRHPIYTSMFLLMLGFAAALGHPLQLVLAIPLFLVGARIRTAAEEQLLEASFGEAYRDYARSTPALFPRLR